MIIRDDVPGSRLPSWFPYLDLACVAAAGGLWLFWPEIGPWPLMIGMVPWPIRWYLNGAPGVRTAFDIPILVFLTTAGIGIWSAFDRDAALAKFWLILTAILLFYAFANWAVFNRPGTPERQAWVLSVLGAVTALYFLATHDWQAYPAKIAFLTPIGQALQALLPNLPADRLHPNVAAGILAVLAPFAAAAIRLAWLNGRAWRLLAGLLTLSLILFALLMSTTRGSWLALAAVTLIVAWWYVSRRLTLGRRKHQRWLFFGLPLAIVVGFLLILFMKPAVFNTLLHALPAVDSGAQRAELYANSLSLVQDYPFIGGGLGSYMMLYSTYAILIHVGFSGHSHNLYLDLLIEQGIVALAALAWMWLLMGEAVWRSMTLKRMRRRRRSESKDPGTDEVNQVQQGNGDRALTTNKQANGSRTLLGAAALSLVVMLLHGLIDDALYSSRGLVIMFVPLAFAVPTLKRAAVPSRRQQATVVLAAFGLALLLGLLSWRPLLSLAASNLAAVRQSQAELSVYTRPEWLVQDAVRRAIDLSGPVAGYERALAFNPNNASAARRLGQIELSLGQYKAALDHLVTAYQARPGDTSARRLLAEALVVNGRQQEGQAFWQTVNNQNGQLNARIYWYGSIGEAERQASVQRVSEAQTQ